MKTTLNWYKREANNYNQLGQRLLQKQYGFEGIGKFAALCDILVTLPNCSLNLKENTNEITMLGLDLDFTPEDFIKFINKLLEFNLLIKNNQGNYTTTAIQESLIITLHERAKAYFRKYGEYPTDYKIDSYHISSGELSNSSTEQTESSTTNQNNRENFSQRERESRVEREEREREKQIQTVFTKDFLKEVSENYKTDQLKIENKQADFLKFQKLARKKWKKADDLRTHFLNWLKIELEKEKNSEKKEKSNQVTGKVNYG